MNDPAQIKILLADDHPVVRDGYCRLLNTHPDIRVVAEAADGQEAFEKYKQYKPDVVILDINMPGIGGLETIKKLCEFDPGARILVFSMHESSTIVKRALETGAMGYLSKSCVASQMIEAVRTVSQGKQFINQDLATKLIENQLKGDDPLHVLTEREFQIFRQLAEGLSVQEIAFRLSISPKTAGVHHTNIFKKLGLRNASELTRLAIRYGVIQA
ncbi:response regulator [Kaarinaea lacus]